MVFIKQYFQPWYFLRLHNPKKGHVVAEAMVVRCSEKRYNVFETRVEWKLKSCIQQGRIEEISVGSKGSRLSKMLQKKKKKT